MLGIHYIGKIKGCNLSYLKSNKKIKSIMQNVAKKSNLDIIKKTSHQFHGPKAATYCLLLSQSHFVVHTWPEHNILAFDLFSCGSQKQAEKAISLLKKEIEGKSLEIKRLSL